MADNNKAKNLYTGDPRAEKKFHIGMYYKVAGGYTLVVAILYAVQRALNAKGYIMINSTLPYWLWYALVIGILLVVGRLIANLPKNNVTRRAVKVCVAIVSIFTLFAMYLQCISRIDTDFNKYAVVDSPANGKWSSCGPTSPFPNPPRKGRTLRTSSIPSIRRIPNSTPSFATGATTRI